MEKDTNDTALTAVNITAKRNTVLEDHFRGGEEPT